MNIVSRSLCLLVALIESYAMAREMFDWTGWGRETFFFLKEGADEATVRLPFFEDTAFLAANQGLYNGFLAAALIWAGLFIRDEVWAARVATYALLCVFAAGIYGTFWAPGEAAFLMPVKFQSIPAALALAALYVWRPRQR